MNLKYKFKRMLAAFLSLGLLTQPITAFADERNAGNFTQENRITRSEINGQIYYNQNEGGFTVYVPYSQRMLGNDIFTRMFTYMFNIYQTGKGDNYDAAGAKYSPAGYESIGRVQTKYFVKSLSRFDGQSVPATSNLMQLEEKHNVEFRYAGVMVSAKGVGTVTTNPTFLSDFVQTDRGQYSTHTTETRFDKRKYPLDQETFVESVSSTVKMPNQMEMNWTKGNGIPDNVPRNSPYFANAEEVFETWAARTEAGAQWKAYYEPYAAAQGMEWWEFLREYLRIDGDIKTQSVLLTCVYHPTTGGTRYTTYSIPFPVQNNMVAQSVQILDEKDQILEYSERPIDSLSSVYGGMDAIDVNCMTGQPVKLKKGKTYKIEFGFLFVGMDNKQSYTDKSDTNAMPEITFVYKKDGSSKGETRSAKILDSENSERMTDMESYQMHWLDSSTSGEIKTKVTHTVSEGSESHKYSLGFCTYKNAAFTVDELVPEKGFIRIAIPQAYDVNGDNEYMNDDYIELEYTLDDTPDEPDDDPEDNLYGDMNLGRREYRRLHYKKTVEEDDTDKPIMSTDPTTGESTPTGEYEKKMVDYEYVTDYGWYESYSSAPEGEKEGEWNGVPESSGSIYPHSLRLMGILKILISLLRVHQKNDSIPRQKDMFPPTF